jgi:hypothetical protein
VVWVRERTIPTERPPLVSEAIANLCGYRVPRGQRDGSLRPYSRFSRQEPLFFYQVAPQLYPVPDPLLFLSGSAGNPTRASGSVANNSDHYTTEAVISKLVLIKWLNTSTALLEIIPKCPASSGSEFQKYNNFSLNLFSAVVDANCSLIYIDIVSPWRHTDVGNFRTWSLHYSTESNTD